MKLKKLFTLGLMACMALTTTACGGASDDPTTTPNTGGSSNNGNNNNSGNNNNNSGNENSGGTTTTRTFALGADLSWVTEMEAAGKKFYNASGTETDCFQLMKELGLTAARLRVWVNPENAYGAYCDKADLLAKAQRAAAQGLDLMIDFHYSDFFADPSRQTLPKAWEGKSLSELKTAVADHTKEILNALKEKGLTPKWVQVGNETRDGMLWPTGQLWDSNGDLPNGWSNYVALSNAGYEAVKSVCSDALVIVHIDNAYDDQDWWFKKFTQLGGKMDIIGLSHYPQTNSAMTASAMNAAAVKHIKAWAAAYSKPVMVCEVGVKTTANESTATTVMDEFMQGVNALSTTVYAGTFYWEPEVYGGWKPAYYTTLGWNAYDMGAFTSTGRPSGVMTAFCQ